MIEAFVVAVFVTKWTNPISLGMYCLAPFNCTVMVTIIASYIFFSLPSMLSTSISSPLLEGLYREFPARKTSSKKKESEWKDWHERTQAPQIEKADMGTGVFK